MIRALSEDVPDELLAFFRSDDPDRDSDRFRALLEEWYQDAESHQWHAPWHGFVFPEHADFEGATFPGTADFHGATFTGDADFEGATFTETAIFGGATFTGTADFGDATFMGTASFGPANFTETAIFRGATFTGTGDFFHATFTGRTSFGGATFTGDAIFVGATFTGTAHFVSATFTEKAMFGAAKFAQRVSFVSVKLSDQCRFSLWNCSLAKVELHSLDLRSIGRGVIRLADADDIERLTLRDVQWPAEANRPRTADEADLDDDDLEPSEKPSPEEVERVYRGLRKNHEDRGDRVGAHGWYFSEMEVGRIHARLFSLKRVARGFYMATSNYGLSAIRPALWLGVAVAIALVLFSLGAGWCPARLAVDPTARICVGLQDRLQVALLAIFLQAPPGGVVLSGVLGQVVWLVLRVTGAAMLLSIGIAFRNQVAR